MDGQIEAGVDDCAEAIEDTRVPDVVIDVAWMGARDRNLEGRRHAHRPLPAHDLVQRTKHVAPSDLAGQECPEPAGASAKVSLSQEVPGQRPRTLGPSLPSVHRQKIDVVRQDHTIGSAAGPRGRRRGFQPAGAI
jgi:hypothetical protein